MTVSSKLSFPLLVMLLTACQREAVSEGANPAGNNRSVAASNDAQAASKDGLTPAKQQGKQEITNAPLEAYQLDLLKLGFAAASKFPSNPHSKNRGRAQDLVVAACFRLQQPLQALAFAPHVEGYYGAIAYADFAWCCAKLGDERRTKQYIKLAETVLAEHDNDPNAQEWRSDKVRIKIARALATLGDAAQAQQILAKIAPESSGAVDDGWTSTMADRIGAMTKAAAEQELQRITDTFLSQTLGDQYTSLMILSGIHGQFFADQTIRAATEERLFVRFDKLPTKLRLDAMAPLCGHYVEHGDIDGGRDVIVRMRDLMEKFDFRTEDRIPQLARLAILRGKCGDQQRARAELETALQDYHEHRDEVVNIYRCETLRPLALAWHAVGDSEQANDLVALALEESLENPNSRPRCDDLVETCVDLAEHQLAPSLALWNRMREISEGLSTPW